MNKMFTLTLPVDNVMKSPAQNFQQQYFGNFLLSFSGSLYEHHPPRSFGLLLEKLISSFTIFMLAL